LQEVLAPLNEAIAAGGMKEVEVNALLEEELSAHRAERRSAQGRQ
jgi:hypothetical protein